ncbi:MAG: inositol monophosphatase family protein [Anaerolineales bacterium]
MSPTLAEIEILAQQAGAILRAHYGTPLQIHHKTTATDLVTEVDHASEKFILEQLRLHYPEHQIITEESGQHGTNHAQNWYIDPLDGTVNFAHGIPIFCVSIAYAENGRVTHGVVYDPMRGECFSAERGRGAWLNGRPIRVAHTPLLAQSLLVTGFPYDAGMVKDNNLEQYARFAVRSQGVRRLGSAALDLCYIGAGRFDGYWELRLNSWDVAAGGLIAEEAGAQVTNIRGEPDYLSGTPSIIAANPALHAQLFAVLRGE